MNEVNTDFCFKRRLKTFVHSHKILMYNKANIGELVALESLDNHYLGIKGVTCDELFEISM